MDRHFISICMITWNEAALLPGAIQNLDSFEVVVGDTGSTDNTVILAKSLGCKVITGLDRFHKANARNLVIDAASGKWVVILDADEVIENPEGLREFLENTDADALTIRLRYTTTPLEFSQMRIWKKGLYQYKYRAHEVPLGSGKVIINTDFVWLHTPVQERNEWKLQYTLDRLLLDVEENPNSSRSKYYLGRQYCYLKQWMNGLEMLGEYLHNPDHDEANAYFYMAQAFGELKNEKEQIKSLYLACAAKPYRRELWGTLAEIYYHNVDYITAAALLKCALEYDRPQTDYVNEGWYGSHIYDLLARCYYKLNQFEKGLPYAKKAVKLEPSERLKKNLLWFEYHLGNQDAAYKLFGADMHANQPRHAEIAKYVIGPRVLDYGCGTGDLLLELDNKDFELFGVDSSKTALQMAKERGVKAKLFEQWPDGSWDTVICSQVLEHMDAPETWVQEAKQKARYLLVSVPKDNMITSPDHKHVYSEDGLRQLLSPAGQVELLEWNDKARILAMVKVHNGDL
jgi:glycosyltransferase involved in cell wall biosynthesis